jgi:phosphate transport system permease protein
VSFKSIGKNMTDTSAPTNRTQRDLVAANVKKRYAAEKRFRAFGLAMVSIGIIACALLITSIIGQSIPALTQNRLHLAIDVTASQADPAGKRDPVDIRQQGNFYAMVQDGLVARFPTAEADGKIDDLFDVVTSLAALPIGRQIAADPGIIGKKLDIAIPINDDLDLFLKGAFGKTVEVSGEGFLSITPLADGTYRLRGDSGLNFSFLTTSLTASGAVTLGDDKPSILVEAGTGTFKVLSATADTAIGELLVRPKTDGVAAKWTIVKIASPQQGRAVNDATIAFGRQLKAQEAIWPSFNTTVFTNSDSNEPELAGLFSAFIGSLLTLAVTALLAIPIGVATALYLEEFAPKNWLTDLIEVNINNLAAVPSIVFGLLGFAVFLTFFGMPRAAPLVGGIVLALMSLPVIIIASRAALKAVPPSIREAALGVGASKMQAIFHHVLPLALPGIMTGSILAMAHALGETAPLLLIGMVAFIADVPTGLTDSATVLPVELFMWAGRPERAWEPRTALAILALLVFMILMNGLAIFLRRKFERRW